MGLKHIFIIFLSVLGLSQFCFSQASSSTNVDASTTTGTIPPIWRDHYENHLLFGYGGNPSILGAHTSFLSDPNFIPEMNKLKPRYVRVSIGRADNPPDTSYYSTNTTVLKNLTYEFYRGGNGIAEANDLDNYDFTFIDSLIKVVQSMGAEPFLTIDYMPFTLSSDTIPNYQPAMGLLYNLAYDNTIRNAPPSNNEVYGRVIYHLIKHCYDTFGVTYFEHWNEPDQQWLNPIMVKFFWTGDEDDLYDSYEAIANEVSTDANLAQNVKLGGCSFAFYSLGNLIPTRFLQKVQTNAVKFDFLSFHPYSDTQFKGGYDSTKVALATSWRDTYVPNAELINGECGRIDQNADMWGSLDYGLFKIEHIIDMLDRNISMSFEVALFDQETSSDNYSYLGMYRVGPIVPKPAAYVFYNMNRMNDALNRLSLTTNGEIYGLAGRNNTSDKIVIVIPAPNPDFGENEVDLQVSNLPWGNSSFYVNRYELTEESYQLGEIDNLVMSSIHNGAIFNDSIVYTSVNNSGRLLVWELSLNALSTSSLEKESDEITIFPNPASNEINLKFNLAPKHPYTISITNAMGAQVYYEKVNLIDQFHLIPSTLAKGIYIIHIYADGIRTSKKVIID